MKSRKFTTYDNEVKRVELQAQTSRLTGGFVLSIHTYNPDTEDDLQQIYLSRSEAMELAKLTVDLVSDTAGEGFD